ncbi:hypothetical protein CDAR_197631 [Caerostris darwini]|uniref:Uncharacterized protein n=1 Tax=Caerostris darwini TaxID=1538125 RepID=A0AAV4RUV2_9ARAC|nr:hypothetical protein CDAR_197631 [Caerostris darwini]
MDISNCDWISSLLSGDRESELVAILRKSKLSLPDPLEELSSNFESGVTKRVRDGKERTMTHRWDDSALPREKLNNRRITRM